MSEKCLHEKVFPDGDCVKCGVRTSRGIRPFTPFLPKVKPADLAAALRLNRRLRSVPIRECAHPLAVHSESGCMVKDSRNYCDCQFPQPSLGGFGNFAFDVPMRDSLSGPNAKLKPVRT